MGLPIIDHVEPCLNAEHQFPAVHGDCISFNDIFDPPGKYGCILIEQTRCPVRPGISSLKLSSLLACSFHRIYGYSAFFPERYTWVLNGNGLFAEAYGSKFHLVAFNGGLCCCLRCATKFGVCVRFERGPILCFFLSQFSFSIPVIWIVECANKA